MAKLLQDNLEISIKLERQNGEIVIDCSAHYEVSAEEYGMSSRKGTSIILSDVQETAIKKFAGQVIKEIKDHEAIS